MCSAKKLPKDIKRLILLENYKAVIPKLKPLANSGNPEAQFQIGLLYLHGSGVKKSKREALFWFEKAASVNHTKALFNAATLLLKQNGSAPKAEQYLKRAAQQGHKMAANKLKQLTRLDTTTYQNESGKERLWYAAKKGDQQGVQSLISGGIDINSPNGLGQNALTIAIDNGHEILVTYLIANGANTNAQDLLGETPLHRAVKTHQADLLKVLLKSARLDMKNKQGVTPLFLAVMLNDMLAATLLLEAGADVDTQNSQQQSVFALAKAKNNKKIVRLLTKFGADAATNDHKKMINSRLNNLRKQLTQPQYKGWSELMLASWLGEKKLVSWLLGNTPFDSQYTIKAYELALQAGHKSTAMILAQRLVRRPMSETVIVTLLTQALQADALNVFKKVYREGVDHSAGAIKRVGPQLFFSSITMDKEAFTRYLIDQQVNTDFIAEDGSTSLIRASVRQAKLVITCRVKVPVGQGVACHPYRVLRVVRSLRLVSTFQREDAIRRTNIVKRRQRII